MFVLKCFWWQLRVKLHRGTFLNVIQMHRNIFPAYLKSPGAAARTAGADSPLSFVGAIVGAACWDWGCNEGAATPRWGCICCPKTVRQWLNEWGLNVIVMHRDNSPFIQLKMWRPLSSAEWEMRGEKATAIQSTIWLPLCLSWTDVEAIFIKVRRYMLLHLHAFSAQMKPCVCTKWRDDAMEPRYDA